MASTPTNNGQPSTPRRGPPEYHPSYSAEDATLVLRSIDGMKFKVHRFIVKMASEVFQNMLTQAIDTGEPVELQERSQILSLLLDSIYPNGAYLDLNAACFDTIWELLIAAEKYDFTRIVDEYRIRIMNDSYFSKHPLEAFVIATRFEWNEVANEKALDAIDDLSNPDSFRVLAFMDSTHILKLQKFADIRKRALLKMVGDVLEDQFFYDMQAASGEHWEEKEHMNRIGVTKTTVKAFANENLCKMPSGRSLRHVFEAKHVKKLVGDGWDQIYDRMFERALEHIPRSVDDIRLECIG